MKKQEVAAKKAKIEVAKKAKEVNVVVTDAQKRRSVDSGYDLCNRASIEFCTTTTTTGPTVKPAPFKKSGISNFTSICGMNNMVATKSKKLGIIRKEWHCWYQEKKPVTLEIVQEKRVKLTGERRVWDARRMW
ncbi:hypothetical protein SAICODRAFT_8018 [Saitoella complicata NRRL Y-17804]|uniref:uncharacterized protein n=1 Tax=Saitoella complicata (strain BCRC 22490 / CBS 7301 / JCM 7358 / NBRC 10748 / NRRL Y-17804) TaxID=698492 RepID=UPI0008674057|nr:uncharacterized protein SAICODRAFT_8018 [Saitoella complicata NRRL Y-17804]ODQ52589.1 hypothetical protein SAICODRAFT_8018 [Saitoella complicata NRRL Y-17804]